MRAFTPEEVARRFEDLGHAVLGPLVLGGALSPVRPIGAVLAFELGRGGRVLADVDLASRIDVARVRQARLLAPVDTLPPPGEDEWALVAALNDLLQTTNHELAGPFTRGRHARLLASVLDVAGRVPAPRTVAAALARHATLARALDVIRTDTRVRWWTGAASFRGQAPPGRLLAWPELRRVHVEPEAVPLPRMPEGLPALGADAFEEALAAWLGRSPLTDLATAGRAQPVFGWSRSTLSLVAAPAGRVLAARAAARAPREATLAALDRACLELPRLAADAAPLAKRFVEELAAREGGASR
jgi:hypothetical protein